MSRVVRGTMYGAVAVLVLEAVGSLASRALGFEYDRLTPLLLVIFLAIGAYVGVAEPVGRVAAVGALIGAIDATAGWAIAWLIGPGQPQAGERITLLGLFNTTLFVAVLGAAVAAIGAWLTRRVRRGRSAA